MIVNFLFLFLFSLISNFFILLFAKIGLFGKNLSKLTKHFLIKQPLSFYLLYFIFIFIFISYTQFAVIYCEGQDLTLKAQIENVQITLTGDFIKQVVENIGAATVFSAGLQIGASILSKHKISTIPRLGMIGGTGVGFTVAFKALNVQNFTGNNGSVTNAITFNLVPAIPTSPNTSGEGINFTLSRLFGTGGVSIEAPIAFNNHTMIATAEQTSDVINALDNQNPDWRDIFINSPLESVGTPWINFILELLTDSLHLQFIIVYLSTMAIIIFTCKLIVDKNINFEWIKGYIFGKSIHWGITKYISIWRTSANLWIYFLLINLWIFNTCQAFILYKAIGTISSTT